jgi:hypothetical protein
MSPAGRHATLSPMSVETVTLKIPKPLYLRLQTLIEHTGFRSPTEFVLFVLRDLTGAETEDLEQVRDRLKKLGYL